MDLVVGVDAGGTASRAVVATLTGDVVGRGCAGPGNPVSARESAAEEVSRAITYALGAHPPSSVVGAVLGLAGVNSPDDPALAPMSKRLELTYPITVVGDVVTAFAAGTPHADGSVLIAGTGAIAARIAAHRIVATVDGLGWLLGDEGSGRWIGLQTVRAAVRDWPGSLGRMVAAASGAPSAEEAVRWAQGLPFAEIGALAPLVCAAARAGDPAAAEIVDAAAGHLIATLDDLGGRHKPPPPRNWVGPSQAPRSDNFPRLSTGTRLPTGMRLPTGNGRAVEQPVVLAGGLLTGDTPVRDHILAVLRKRSTPTGTARDPAAAAAWLAARDLSPLPPAELHARLVGAQPSAG